MTSSRILLAFVALAASLVAADATAQNKVARGKVVDENGEGVSGASVTLERLGDAHRAGRSTGTDAGTGTDAEYRYDAETDDKGQYSLMVFPGSYRVVVSRDGYQGAGVEGSVGPGSPPRLPDIRIVSLASARAAAVEADEVLGPLRHAMELTRAGRLDEAEASYKEVLAVDPSVVEAHFNLGTIYLERQDYAAARGEFEKVIELDPASLQAYPALSRACAALGDDERALEVMAEGVALEPENARMQFNLGVLYYNARRTEEAEATLLQVESLEPENVRVQFMLANLALNRSDLAGAAARFERYLAEAPADAPNRETAETLLEQLRPALGSEP
jgi:tetratricopeptide (TPR) repeat protein